MSIENYLSYDHGRGGMALRLADPYRGHWRSTGEGIEYCVVTTDSDCYVTWMRTELGEAGQRYFLGMRDAPTLSFENGILTLDAETPDGVAFAFRSHDGLVSCEGIEAYGVRYVRALRMVVNPSAQSIALRPHAYA